MKLIDRLLGMREVLGRFPCVVVGSKSFPRNQVFQPVAFNPRVKDVLDQPFLSVTALDRRRWRLSTPWNCVGLMWLEKADMEHVVNFHRTWQLETIR